VNDERDFGGCFLSIDDDLLNQGADDTFAQSGVGVWPKCLEV
jgi:hypothetical protein